MSDFVTKIVGLLSRNGFTDYPTRRRGLKSEVVIMAGKSNLVLILGPFQAQNSSFLMNEVQREFEQYLEQDLMPIIDYYDKGFDLHSVKFVMQSGGSLQLPFGYGLEGIEFLTELHAERIVFDFPGVGTLSL